VDSVVDSVTAVVVDAAVVVVDDDCVVEVDVDDDSDDDNDDVEVVVDVVVTMLAIPVIAEVCDTDASCELSWSPFDEVDTVGVVEIVEE